MVSFPNFFFQTNINRKNSCLEKEIDFFFILMITSTNYYYGLQYRSRLLDNDILGLIIIMLVTASNFYIFTGMAMGWERNGCQGVELNL